MLKDFTTIKFDILIQAGQSNSEGYGAGPVEEPYEPVDQVWFLNGDFTISRAAEWVVKNEIQSTFALPFAREYLKAGLLEDGRNLLILRTAVGGTGFLGEHWNMTGGCYLRMMEMIRTALALNPENRLTGLLWHQGEADACAHASYEVHYENLMKMLVSVREEFKTPNLPFIAADFVHPWVDNCREICEPVLKAIQDVCRDCGYGGYVATDDLLCNFDELHRKTQCGEDEVEDIIHFSRKSLYILGKRYFDAFMKLK